MVSRTASLRLQLIDAVSGPSKNAANALRGVDSAISRFGRGGSPAVQKLVKQLEYLQKKAGSIEDFTASRRGFKDLATQMAAARSNVARLEQALKSASQPTGKMKADLESARAVLKSTTQAFKEQGAAVRGAERALSTFGIAGRRDISGSQKAIRGEIAKTIREMRRLDQEANKPRPRRNGGAGAAFEVATAAAGAYTVNQGKNLAEKSFFTHIDFDQAAAFQAALGDFKGEDRASLNQQAEKIGGDTRFSNVDVVRAQTTVLQRGIRDVKTIEDLTAQITDYALAMGVTLEEGAEAVTGSALSKQVNLKDTKAIGNFVDFLVWMAKNGGMSNEDVSQFVKYAGAPTSGAKLPDPYMAAMGMILRNAGVRGDEAGVFGRSAASKLVAPTQKGKDALAAMGIDFSKFTKIDAMNTDGIGIMMKNKFGERLTEEMKAAVEELINNGEFTDPETGESRSVISDSGEFVSQMSNILAPLFGGKNGKMPAQDAKALAKALAEYQKYSIESVDAVGLMNAIAAADPGIGNLNAFFTDKQGGRANMIFSKWAEFQRLLSLMQNVPGGVANKIGLEANQGIYGDWTKLTGTVETALLRVSQDWEFASRPLIRGIDSAVDGFTHLSDGTRRLVEAFAVAAGILAGGAALKAGGGLIGRILGLSGGAAAGAAAGTANSAGAGGALGWLASKTPHLAALAALLSLSGSSATNAYADASPEDRQKMRDEARARAAQINAEQTAKESSRAQAEAQQQANVSGLQNQLGSITKDWPLAAKKAITSFGLALAEGGPEAEAQAAQIGQRVERALSVEGKPTVATADIERALGLARQLAAALRAAPGSSGTPTNTNTGFGGPRAKGGPVQAGKAYLVGENGPEPFFPGQSGTILPNSSLGGGGNNVVVHQTNHFHGKGGGHDVDSIVRALDRQLNRAAQIAFSGIRYGDK